jgi:hypothetical protein
MIENGRLPVDKLIDSEIALRDLVKDGFEPLLDPGGSMMKILVKLSAGERAKNTVAEGKTGGVAGIEADRRKLGSASRRNPPYWTRC